MVLSWTETQTAPPTAKGGALRAKLPHIAGFKYKKILFKERLELISFKRTNNVRTVLRQIISHLISPYRDNFPSMGSQDALRLSLLKGSQWGSGDNSRRTGCALPLASQLRRGRLNRKVKTGEVL